MKEVDECKTKTFRTVLKNNSIIFSIGIILTIAGEWLPIREFKPWSGIELQTNLVQILGVIFCLLPVFIWFIQRRHK